MPASYLLADLLCVLVQALLQLAGVGADTVANVIGVLLHHGFELSQVLGAALLGVHHVGLQLVGQQLQVLGQLAGGVLGIGAKLGLDAFSVNVQLCHGVSDEGAGMTGGRLSDIGGHQWRHARVNGVKNPKVVEVVRSDIVFVL